MNVQDCFFGRVGNTLDAQVKPDRERQRGKRATEAVAQARHGDDDANSTLACRARVLDEQVWRSMRRHDARLAGHTERVQRLHRVAHGLPV